MKIKAFLTDKSVHMQSVPVFATDETMPGALRLTPTGKEFDDFSGFGVCLTGGSCYLLEKADEATRKKLIENLFSTKEATEEEAAASLKNGGEGTVCSNESPYGLGLNVGRLCVGSNDYSAELYCYEDKDGNFSLEKDRAYVIPAIKEILKVAPDMKLFSSPWSPPARMKSGNSLCGGYMRDKFIEEFADYYVSYLLAMKDEGIDIFALTPQNEPGTEQQGRMPACVWSPDQEAQFILILSEKLKKNGLDPEIWIHDHHFAYWERVLWQFKEYPELKNVVNAVAFHYYEGSPEDVENLREKIPYLEYHFTEGGPRLYDNYGSDWCKWGMIMARSLNHGLKSFTGFNFLLDEKGGPDISPFGCAGLVTVNSVTGNLTYSGQYRAFAHFSRFIKRGAKIMPAAITGYQATFSYSKPFIRAEGCMAVNPDGSIVVEVVNPSEDKRQLTFTVNGQNYYLEVKPDSISTVILSEE